MHGSRATNARLLEAVQSGARQAPGVAIVVCVPFPYLQQAATALEGSAIAWGGQTLSEHDTGAYTGEVSGGMLREFGCRYAIVGHSERRALYGEDDSRVAAKFVAARRAGLVPIVCVGETLDERERGATDQVVGRQLDAVIAAGGASGLAGAVVAYEPVWAIGTGKTATPEDAEAAHAHIRGIVAHHYGAERANRLRIQYGGSLKPGVADEIFAKGNVDGGLIGGASLKASEFVSMCKSAAATAKTKA